MPASIALAAFAGSASCAPPSASAHAAKRLPADVVRWIERREECDHWRGEEPYDEERAREIARAVARACRGTDRQLAALRARYAQNRAVVAALAEFDDKVE